MTFRIQRLLQAFFGLVFGGIGLMWAIAALMSGNASGALAGLVPFVMGAVFVGVFEFRMRSFKKAGKAVLAAITECSKSVFDRPGQVSEGYDIDATAANTLLAGFAREPNNDAAFTTEGSYGEAKVSVASHVSIVGRQVGEFHHVYSHVVVDVLGLNKPFRISKERVSSKLAKALGAVADAKVGDEAFDSSFIVSTEEGFARGVLDESIRKRLLSLQAESSKVSVDYGAGGMSVLLSNRGLALRWPGEIDPKRAAFIRDLLIDMRKNMLAYENKSAARAGAGAADHYRVASDEPAEVEADAEAERARSAG